MNLKVLFYPLKLIIFIHFIPFSFLYFIFMFQPYIVYWLKYVKKISFNFNKLRHYNRTVDTFQMSLILNIFLSKYFIIYLYYIYNHLHHCLKDNLLCIMYNDFMYRIQKSLDYNLINEVQVNTAYFFLFVLPNILVLLLLFPLLLSCLCVWISLVLAFLIEL